MNIPTNIQKQIQTKIITFYEDSTLELAKEGKILPDLEFVIHYNMPSFFDRFNF